MLYNQEEIQAEEDLRRKFLKKALDAGVQIVQLPCPEFTLYGAHRWGHVSEQFDNPFFRNHCRKILEPIMEQMEEYLTCGEFFEILGVVGVDGSPSCGVDYTCSADWYGAFDCNPRLPDMLGECKMVKRPAIFMQELIDMLKERGWEDQVTVRSLYAPEPDKCLDLIPE